MIILIYIFFGKNVSKNLLVNLTHDTNNTENQKALTHFYL